MSDTELTVSLPLQVKAELRGLDFKGLVQAVREATDAACSEPLGWMVRAVERRAVAAQPPGILGIRLATTARRSYDFDMIADDIRDLLRCEPFFPFRLILTGGKAYVVLNPQTAVLMKRDIFVALPDGERGVHVPLPHISSIETFADGRGRKSARRGRR